MERSESIESVESVETPEPDNLNDLSHQKTAVSSRHFQTHLDDDDEEEEEAPKQSAIKKIWIKTGLDVPTILLMLKGGIAPTIALAFYQADAVADEYTTLGYLVGVAALLGLSVLPRAKFIQNMLMNVFAICLGSSITLFALWTSYETRKNTTDPDAPPSNYNSSVSAVCAIWLFVQIYFVNAVRSALPQFQPPAILYSIFVNVGLTFGPQFHTLAAIRSFAKRLLVAFLTGFGLSTGVSLLILPVNSRTVVFKQFIGYIQGCKDLLKAQTKYMASLEDQNMFRAPTARSHAEAVEEQNQGVKSVSSPEAVALKKAVDDLRNMHGKIEVDLVSAKRELAWGKLKAHDLTQLHKLLREVFLPLAGATSLIDIFQRIAELYGWDRPKNPDCDSDQCQEQECVSADWQSVMKALHEPFSQISQAMDQALEHVLLTLELTKPAKTKKRDADEKIETSESDDIEAKGDLVQPGDRNFVEYFAHQTQVFYNGRASTLRTWANERGIRLPSNMAGKPVDLSDLPDPMDGNFGPHDERDQRQLLVLLFMEHLLWAASQSTLQLIQFADSKVTDGTMKKRRLIFPGARRLKKWFFNIFKSEDNPTSDQPDAMLKMEGDEIIHFGQAYQGRKDPEHLEPTTLFEKIGERLRIIPKVMGSSHSAFGLRVAVATMSIGIVAFLKDTWVFFTEQRLVWAMIMVAISMTRTSGQSILNFVLRTLGTFMAICASFVIYYVVDGKTPGVFVLMYIWICLAFYIILKKPKYIVIGLISAISAILIVGYEMQVRKIGVEKATSNGQLYYPIYKLAPYRLACVTGGLFVAFFWTIFPYPMSDHSELRKNVAASLYLLANHYAATHETVGSRIRQDGESSEVMDRHARQLEKARSAVYAKQALLFARMRSTSEFSKWEVPIGGKFPKEIYDRMIHYIESITSFSALMSYTSRTFIENGENQSSWQKDLRELMPQNLATSHEITSTIALLASSVSSGQPLPPYLKSPEPYRLWKRLVAVDRDILSISHIAEPGYAAFAVLQVATRSIVADLSKLIEEVKLLVGELDFSYHVVSTSNVNLNKETKID